MKEDRQKVLSPRYLPAGYRRKGSGSNSAVLQQGNVTISNFSRTARFFDTRKETPGPLSYNVPRSFDAFVDGEHGNRRDGSRRAMHAAVASALARRGQTPSKRKSSAQQVGIGVLGYNARLNQNNFSLTSDFATRAASG